MKSYALAALVLMFNAAPALAADPPEFEKAHDAYLRGDYAAEVKLIRPLAERGDPLAQSILGGNFADGRGVKQDYIEAYKWLDLSIARIPAAQEADRATVIKRRDEIAAKMKPEQISAATKLAKDWKPKK